MGLQVCVPIGGGAFACQYVPSPPVAGAHVLTIEGGVIYWKNLNPNPIPESPQSVMRKTRRPKKRGK
jgi:hypothetical protein